MPQSINHRYQLLDKLGQGGMGVVYKAQDQLSGDVIALKQVIVSPHDLQFVSTSDGASESASALALALEFRTLASLRHPHIVAVLDYGFDAHQQPFYTMQLIEDAQTITDYGQDQPLDEHINLLIEILQALTYLHRRGIIHRDLKPANVLVTIQKSVKVMDFGLALNRGESSSDGVVGTLMYMAPELFSEEAASIQSDLYALGVMAYELFIGHHPFNSQNTAILLNNILTSVPDTSMLENDLADVLDRLLSKEPSLRYESAQDVIAALCMATHRPPPIESHLLRESFLQASAFIGRETELDQLKTALMEAMEGRGSSWLVGGESGIGKSRLLDEVRTRAMVRGALVLRGQAVAEGGLPYQLWRDVLRRLILGVDLSELEASILKAVVPDIGTLLGREVPSVAPLDASASVQRLSLTIIDIFKRPTQPIVLILEDLHWASESLEPLKHLALFAQGQGQRWLMIGSYRDDEAPDLPQWLPGMQVMKLLRLSETAIADLSAEILGEAGKQPEIIDLLKRETEGNAFFMVEVVRALAEEAGTLSAIGHTTLPQGIMTGGVQAIVRRRLDRLPGWAQPILKLAAVAGRQLDLNVLRAAQPTVDWDTWLNACAEAAVLDVSDNAWRFSHDKLREAVLSDTPVTDQPPLYRRVAEAIEVAYPNDNMQAEVLMEYWHTAGDISKTLFYTRQSVERLVRLTADYERAKPLIERGLRLAQQPEMAHHLPYLYTLFAALWAAKGSYELAEEHYKIAEMDVRENTSLRIQILNELSAIDWRRGQYETAQKTAQDALNIAKMHQDRKGIAFALNNLGSIADYQGYFPEARKLYEESLIIRQELGDLRDIASSLSNMGVIAMFQGHYAQAHDFYAQSIAIRRQIGDRQGTANSLNNMAVIAMNQGDNKQARLLNEESLVIRRQIGDKHNIANSLNNLGLIALEQGDYDQAQTYYIEALSIQREVDDRWGIANSLANLGLAAINQGGYERGQAYHDESLAIQREMGDRGAIAISLMNLGWSAYLQEQYDQAQAYQSECLALRRDIGDRRDIANTLVHMALVALARSDYEQARLLSDESLALQREIGDRRGIMNSLANLGFIHIHNADWKAASSAWRESLSLSLEIEMTMHRLDVLVGIAAWWFNLTRYEAAAHIVGLAQAHSATRADTKMLYLLPLLNELRIVLDVDSLSQALAVGASSDLRGVITRIVVELMTVNENGSSVR